MTQSIAGRRPASFDALKLSASGETIAGEVDAASLPRIVDRLAVAATENVTRQISAEAAEDDEGSARIAWSLVGGVDGQRRPSLTLTLSGTVPLVCQRCLQPFAQAVDQSTELLLARSEAELARLDLDDIEVVLATERLDPLMLVEDELLLSLPFAPRHADGECEAVPAAAGARESGESRPSPFGQLGMLKKRDR
jgi:uncharacterized protein